MKLEIQCKQACNFHLILAWYLLGCSKKIQRGWLRTYFYDKTPGSFRFVTYLPVLLEIPEKAKLFMAPWKYTPWKFPWDLGNSKPRPMEIPPFFLYHPWKSHYFLFINDPSGNFCMLLLFWNTPGHWGNSMLSITLPYSFFSPTAYCPGH